MKVKELTLNNPLRDITLNRDELLKHAEELAKLHAHLGIGKKNRTLLPRVSKNAGFLRAAHSEITRYAQSTDDILPAAEWFLDNYYLLKDLEGEIRKNFPRKYERELPCLASGDFAGYPRIYVLMLELIEHKDSEFDREVIEDFINAYQGEVPLSSAEIWAIPIMLRIVLLENIRRLTEQILYTQQERDKAEAWLSPFIKSIRTDEEWAEILSQTEMPTYYSSAFAERLLRRIRDLGMDVLPVTQCLDKAVRKQDTTMEKLVVLEHQRQAMCQVSIGHCILSIRYLNMENWTQFFEQISVVHKLLEKDPSGIFSQMDFNSRDNYRHHVEEIARRYRVSEQVVVQKVLEKSQKGIKTGLSESHVGYYLISSGRQELEKEMEKDWGKIRKIPCSIRRFLTQKPNCAYFGAIIVSVLLLEYLFLFFERLAGIRLNGVISFLLALVPLSGLAIPLIHAIFTHVIPPFTFPKLELKEGIAEELRTMVVIPTLLPNVARVKEILEQMEVYFLANQEANLYFALLGDFTDATEEELPSDREIIRAGEKGVGELNEKYGKEVFYFFHRKRLWNPAERLWMGWERKRGKLIEFNRLLLAEGNTSYTVQVGDLSLLSTMKYIITLDADTQLPRDTAKKLIGTMAHPLNRPRLNGSGDRVVEGYAVLQPRIGVSVLSANTSFFAKIFSGKTGIDPYTTAVSNIYQDLFGEGIFTGKGIYDLRVFHKVTGHIFPENTILSHDLIEGLYARAGLVTDIILVDGYPAKYHAYMRRLHRWTRGDWQIIPWLFKPLPAVSKWKIIDNLRRSLEAPFQVLLIILGFAISGHPRFWAGLAVISFIWPMLINLWDRKIMSGELGERLIQVFFQLSMLPYQAYVQTDAISRSLVRQFITHKRMLEWEPAADTERRIDNRFQTSWKMMWPIIFMMILFTAFIFMRGVDKGVEFLPLVLLWLISPWLAYYFSLPLNIQEQPVTKEEQLALRKWARRIWAFFEQFVSAEENWLPPDNIQLDPPNGIAHRTSPTNIGLALIANLAAHDFGYISWSELHKRVEETLSTIEKLEGWNGHLYNWYDTLTLKPLQPLYISTVDSGNLAVYMLTLSNGLKELLDEPLVERQIHGLRDTLLMLDHSGEKEPSLELFGKSLAELSAQFDLKNWYRFLKHWTQNLPEIKLPEEALFWYRSLKKMLQSFLDELLEFYPWFGLNDKADVKADAEEIEKWFSVLFKGQSPRQLAASYTALLQENAFPFRESAETGLNRLNLWINRSENLQKKLRAKGLAADFRPLFDEEMQLFSIGYRVADRALDASYYDLLASEARQASFLAIAKGDVPQNHWFRLGRSLTEVYGQRSLVSWSGTMFEFLMPLLVMRNFPSTLFDETYQSVLKIQKRYGKERNVPWGISESGFSVFDAQFNYQYKAFGVPGLGLKRGLAKELVISPYSSFLALMVSPREGLKNIRELEGNGLAGRYGLFEAIDYTRERVPLKRNYRIVKSYMAHHQGMSLLALTNVVFDHIFQERFHHDPLIQATELLLQERVPVRNPVIPPPEEQPAKAEEKDSIFEEERHVVIPKADTVVPITHFVANVNYTVMLTNSGSGFSRVGNILISRWREDVTRDPWGMYFYIQNLNSGEFWSATHHPCGSSGEDYRVCYAPDKIEFHRKDGNIGTCTEIIVSPEDQVEIRRISLTNYSEHRRVLEITSYFEVVLAGANEDLAHPAFGKLFVETEVYNHALLASRRPRSEKQERLWLMHSVATDGEVVGNFQYETDRARFIGRGKSLANPEALKPNQPLSNSVGAVIDPIMSLRQRLSIPPGQTVRVSFSTGVGKKRGDVVRLAEKYREQAAVNRAFELALTQSQMELKHLGLTPLQANEALSVGGQLLYLNPSRRKYAEILKRNRKGQSSLWPHAISGDLPIALVRVKKGDDLDLVRQLLKVHEFWRLKGLAVDLVILNEDDSSYLQTFHEQLRDLISVGYTSERVNQSGGIFLLQKSHLSAEETDLIFTAARLVFTGGEGSATAQIRKKGKLALEDDHLTVSQKRIRKNDTVRALNDEERVKRHSKIKDRLVYDNGYGGFSSDGKEYIIHLEDEITTPLPWINVIANPQFGFQVSESGAGFTWAKNSRENKLTPWSNDPILDPPGEVLYIQDEENGIFWSPTPTPVRSKEPYTVRHGQGYSIFEHSCHGIHQELRLYAALDKPLKIVCLKLRNDSGTRRRLSIIYYVEWVLGVARELTSPYIITDFDEERKVLFARNTYQEEFADRVGFLYGLGGEAIAYTGDRTEFIGRNGSLSEPQVMDGERLSNSVGAGYDPCGALQLQLTLLPGEEKTIAFLLGEEESQESVIKLLDEYGNIKLLEQKLEEVKTFWNSILDVVKIETPDKSMDLLLNRWLLYQTMVCRLWARSAFYQSGGAIGFRDQLQDVMAMVIADPAYTREQIKLHCAHQFLEGDVQHWWHAEKSKGIRTKFSDDLLWLPFVLTDYLEHTQDDSILDEQIGYLEDRPLGEEEDERYSIPQFSNTKESVYEHCLRAIERSLRFGVHGLPLIGSGDWNDGFSQIGVKGKGESVWLGWFLFSILKRFADVCERRHDGEIARKYRETALQLQENMERHGWDGGWYRRAFFDDGTPLGSAQNEECQIDAIAQSWAVLSGGARPSRASDAMLALEHYLWKKEEGILALLSPPFNRSKLEPGYIKGYVPGVRENGGQYTHAAIWSILAFAKLGDGNKAFELFKMLNPINHARTEGEVLRYKTEPYVMAADVYAVSPHMGRGGWTWYTGAAGWMYQAGLEGILGFRLQGDLLTLSPCIPRDWPGYKIQYRYKSSAYTIQVENLRGKMSGIDMILYDGKCYPEFPVRLIDDGKTHIIQVSM